MRAMPDREPVTTERGARIRELEAALRDQRDGELALKDSGACPHCGSGDCWRDRRPVRCNWTGKAVWLDESYRKDVARTVLERGSDG